MAASAILAIKIIADAKGASKGFDQAQSRAQKFGSAMQKAAAPAAVVAAGLIGLGKVAVKSASDQEQAFGGVEAVFGRYSDTVKASAKAAAGSAGLSATAYSEMAARIGGQLKAAGVPMDQIAGKTDKLIGRAADLATTYGGTTVDAVESLSAAFRGEGDSAEKYNLQLSASAVQAELAAKGQDKLKGAALAQAKVQATQALIFKQSGDAAGQFAKQTDSLAEKQQISKANMDNMAATMGQVLLPIVGAVTDQLGKLATWMGKNATTVQILAGVIGGLAAVILTITAAMRVYAVVQGIVNAVMAANPAVIVALAIVALIAVIVLLVKNWKTVARVAATVWKAISAAAAAAGRLVSSIWRAVFGKVTAGAKAVRAAVSAVFRGIGAVAKAVGSGVRSGWSATMSAARRATSTAGSAIRTGWRATGTAMRTAGSAVRTGWSNAMSGIRSAGSKTSSALRTGFNKLPGPVQAIARAISSSLVGALRTLGQIGAAAFNVILHPVQSVQSAISNVIGAVQSLISWLGRIKVPSIKIPFTGGGKSVAAPAPAVAGVGVSATARGGVSGRSTATAGAGDTWVINAPLGDGDQIARSLDLILSRRARRTGGVRRIGTRLSLVSGS